MFRWLALASVVIFVVALAGAIVSTQRSAETSQQQPADHDQQKQPNQKENKTLWDRCFPDSISVYTLFLVVFSAVLAFAGIIQLNFLNRAEGIALVTAQAAKDSADAAQKAIETAKKH
jgi:hypothetical protein